MKSLLLVIGVFSCSGIVFAQTETKLTASDAAESDLFGRALSVNGDTAVVGAAHNDDAGSNSGSAYVFTRDAGGAWSEQTKLTASDATEYDYFGYAVSVDGDTTVIGARHADNNFGSAYVFTRDAGGAWSEQAKLNPSDGVMFDWFGWSVSIDFDTIVVGAKNHSDIADHAGAAYVFTRDVGGTWTEQAELNASDAAAGDSFGSSVSVSGDTAIIGADYDDNGGSDTGSAYVFTRNSGGTWSEQAKLTASDAAEQDWFGCSVSVSGDTAIVGAYGNDDSGRNTGSAYVFTRNTGGAWSEQEKLTGSGTAVTWFGFSVSNDGDTAVIGVRYDEDGGSAYVFTRNTGGTWSEQAILTASDAAVGDEFGFSVSVDGDTALVGAHYDEDAGNNSGSAYIFSGPPIPVELQIFTVE